MLGQIQEWFYHDLAGIQNGPDSAGFKKIVIDPHPVGDVTWAKASYDSVRGKITSDWKREGNKFSLKVTIPVNSTGTVYVPTNAAENLSANGVTALRSPFLLRMEKDRAVFAIPSGDYEFKSEWGN
jgi:alpha-L-rhamnosidase